MSKFQPQNIKSRVTQGLAEDYFSLMQECPFVRLNEFIQLKNFAKLKLPKKILDVPTEGILMRNLYPDVSIDQVDWVVPGNIFQKYMHKETDFKFKNLHSDHYDAILGIVPIHHANDIEKSQYLSHSHRVLKSSGVIAFGEIEQGSKPHYFLDEFVHLNSVNGHQGAYLDESFNTEMSAHGLGEVASVFRPCPWVFESMHQLTYFFTKFFGLNPMEDEHLINQVKQYLTIEEKNNKISVEWGLRYFRGIKI